MRVCQFRHIRILVKERCRATTPSATALLHTEANLGALDHKTNLNLVWATGCNIVAIPVAAGLFVHWGFDLPMRVGGAVAMSLSTMIVVSTLSCFAGLKLLQNTLRHNH
jgi:hypothetical protein